jgi:hypothetical protein
MSALILVGDAISSSDGEKIIFQVFDVDFSQTYFLTVFLSLQFFETSLFGP